MKSLIWIAVCLVCAATIAAGVKLADIATNQGTVVIAILMGLVAVVTALTSMGQMDWFRGRQKQIKMQNFRPEMLRNREYRRSVTSK